MILIFRILLYFSMLTQRKLIQREQLPQQYCDSDLNSWQFHYKKIKENLQGTEEEKEAIIRRRILRYFGQFKLQSQNYFSMRLDVEDINNPFLKILTNQILLYGADYLSIDKAKYYFTGFITQVRRVDDSHFLIQFRNQKECFNGLVSKIRKQKISYQFLNATQLFMKSPNSGWVQLQSYRQFIFQRPLMARYLTNFDRIQQKLPSSRSSLYYAYSEAKRKFLKSLKDELLNRNSQKNQHQLRNRSRSKQKSGHTIDEHQCEKHPRSIKPIKNNDFLYHYRPCQCCCTCHRENRINIKGRRNRSNSRDSGYCSSMQSDSGEDKYVNKASRSKQKLSILDQKIVQDSDYRFELYIKNRDKKQKKSKQTQINNKNDNQKQIQKTVVKNISNNQFTQKQHLNGDKIQQFNPFMNNPQIDLSISRITPTPINNKFQSLLQKMDEQKSNIGEDSMNFQLYLQKLKLEDSSQDFSAFDLDIQ